MSDQALRIAEKLAADWQNKAAYENLSGDLLPADIGAAYRAQSAFQRLISGTRGEIVGRKIALSSKPLQEMCGIDRPIAGSIFASTFFRSPAKVSLDLFRHVGVEFELAFELGQDLPPGGTYDAATVTELIAGVRPAFELIEDKGADYADLDVLTLIADNAWNGGVVLGSPFENWQDLNFNDLEFTVEQNGMEPEQGNTGAAKPYETLAWVLDHFSAQGTALRKGEHIITGSAIRTRFPTAGDKMVYSIAGASVEVEFRP